MRRAPGSPAGTAAISCFSNQLIGLVFANSFTLVGLILVSIGPAISVIVRGCALLPDSAISATAASTGTVGWQTATTCVPGPNSSMNCIRCAM